MRSDDLTREQYRRLSDSVGRMHGYLVRLCLRLEQLRVPSDDPLRTRADAASDALHSLWVHCHYGSCGMLGAGDMRACGTSVPTVPTPPATDPPPDPI